MDNFFELENLEDFCKNHPDSIVFAILASKYLEKDLVDKALEVSEAGVVKHPTYSLGHFILGQCHYQLKDYTKAKTHLELALAYDEKNPRAWKLVGDINKKFDLPLIASECNLQYYLLDPFNKDAVKLIQQEDMMTFEAFEDDGNLDFDLTPEEETDASGEQSSEDRGLEVLFDKEDAEEEIDITQQVDEVLKESLDNMSIEADLEKNKEQIIPEYRGGEERLKKPEDIQDDVFENIDLIDVDEPQPGNTVKFAVDEDTGEKTGGLPGESIPEDTQEVNAPGRKTETPDETKAFDDIVGFEEENAFANIEDDLTTDDTVDIGSELEDFFSEYEEEELDSEKTEDSAEKPNFGNILFDESVVKKKEPQQTPPDEDLQNYSSFVDEVISDKEDTPSGRIADVFKDYSNHEEPEIPQPEDVKKDLPEKKEVVNFKTDTSHISQTPPPKVSQLQNTAARFKRPPILSPTLGEIYISQGRFQEALEVFQQLHEKEPGNERFTKKINDVRQIMLKKSV